MHPDQPIHLIHDQPEGGLDLATAEGPLLPLPVRMMLFDFAFLTIQNCKNQSSDVFGVGRFEEGSVRVLPEGFRSGVLTAEHLRLCLVAQLIQQISFDVWEICGEVRCLWLECAIISKLRRGGHAMNPLC